MAHKKPKYEINQKVGCGKVLFRRYEKGWRYYINFFGNFLID